MIMITYATLIAVAFVGAICLTAAPANFDLLPRRQDKSRIPFIAEQ